MNVNENEVEGWFKSSFCDSGSGGCVEVAVLPEGIAVRDGKDPGGAVLWFTEVEWASFVAGVSAGEFTVR